MRLGWSNHKRTHLLERQFTPGAIIRLCVPRLTTSDQISLPRSICWYPRMKQRSAWVLFLGKPNRRRCLRHITRCDDVNFHFDIILSAQKWHVFLYHYRLFFEMSRRRGQSDITQCADFDFLLISLCWPKNKCVFLLMKRLSLEQVVLKHGPGWKNVAASFKEEAALRLHPIGIWVTESQCVLNASWKVRMLGLV